jgi:hypothetical protein
MDKPGEHELYDNAPTPSDEPPPRPKWLLRANHLSLAGKEAGMLFALIATVLKLFFRDTFAFEVDDIIKLCLFLAGAGLGVDISKIASAVRAKA